MGDPRRQPPARAGRAHHRLAARSRNLWRLVSLPFRREPGLLRLRRRARLPQPLALAVRRDAALQDPSGGARALRGRPAHQLRRASPERGRPAVDPASDIPRRRADRRRGRVRQRAEDQGHAHRDEVRHAGGRDGGRCACRGWHGRPDRLRGEAARELGVAGIVAGQKHPAGICQVRAVGRPGLFRDRHLRAARQGAVDVPPSRIPTTKRCSRPRRRRASNIRGRMAC